MYVNNNLSNTNSRLDTSLSSSVLDYALTLPEGMHTVRFSGDSYTGADTPNSYYRYSSATIIVRSKGRIVTVLLYGISTKAPLAVNSYESGSGWYGWDQYVTKDDLLISISGTGPTDWTALETTGNMPFKIWNITKASTSKGAPSGCYDYGTLIALVATESSDRWRNTLIYLPDNNNNVGNKVYVRSGISTKWLAIQSYPNLVHPAHASPEHPLMYNELYSKRNTVPYLPSPTINPIYIDAAPCSQ